MQIKITKSYGALAHEKHPFFSERPASAIYDKIVVEIPPGFEVTNNEISGILVKPHGATQFYLLDEILTNVGDDPALSWYDGNRKHCVVMKEVGYEEIRRNPGCNQSR